MDITRKTFLKALTAVAATPWLPAAAALADARPPGEPLTEPLPDVELWLEEWQQAPRLPLLETTDPVAQRFRHDGSS